MFPACRLGQRPRSLAPPAAALRWPRPRFPSRQVSYSLVLPTRQVVRSQTWLAKPGLGAINAQTAPGAINAQTVGVSRSTQERCGKRGDPRGFVAERVERALNAKPANRVPGARPSGGAKGCAEWGERCRRSQLGPIDAAAAPRPGAAPRLNRWGGARAARAPRGAPGEACARGGCLSVCCEEG